MSTVLRLLNVYTTPCVYRYSYQNGTYSVETFRTVQIWLGQLKNVSGALCQLISWLISDMCVIFFQGHNADDIAETVIMNGR